MSGRLESDDRRFRTIRPRRPNSSAARDSRRAWDAPFDRLVVDGVLMDMVTGERRAADIGLVGPLIASVHPRGTRTDAVEVIDARGGFVSPGLIDTHMHVESSMVTPAAYADAVTPRGVTTAVWDPHELANVHGLAGVDWALRAARGLALRFIVLASVLRARCARIGTVGRRLRRCDGRRLSWRGPKWAAWRK